MITAQQLLSAFQKAIDLDPNNDADDVLLHIEALTLSEAPDMSAAEESWHGCEPELVVRGDQAAWELELLAIHPGDKGAPVETPITCRLLATDILFARGELNFDLAVEILDKDEKLETDLTGEGFQHIKGFEQLVTSDQFWIRQQIFLDLVEVLNKSGLVPEEATK